MARATRGQSGLDRLLFFLGAVVLLVAVLPFVLQLAGVPVRGPAAGGATSDATDLRILAVKGYAVHDDGSIGELRVVVAGTGPTGEFDLTDATLVFSASRIHELFSVRTDADGGGPFRVSASGPDASDTVLSGPGGRGVFTIDLGSDDVRRLDSVGDRLRPGQQFTVTVIAPGGAAASRNASVPSRVTGEPVALR